MKTPILLVLVCWMGVSQSCFYPVRVTGDSATVYIDVDDRNATIPSSQWEIEVTHGPKHRPFLAGSTHELPLSIHLKKLEEWTAYHVKVTHVRYFTIYGDLYDYARQVVCEGSFTTVPPLLKIDTVDKTHYVMAEVVLGTAQIWNPQQYKFRLEWGPTDTYDFPRTSRYTDLYGVGIVKELFQGFGYGGPVRIRFVIKSRPPFSETYSSPPFVFFDD